VLRVVETARLLLHEDPDAGRVARLREALRRDGVLRNPPAAALMPDGRAVVLDGANRVTALREMGVHHAVVQAVDYGGSGIMLSTWRHYLGNNGAPPLRGLALALPGARTATASEAEDGEALLERREAAAVVFDAEGTLLVGDSREPISAAAQLRALVRLYQGVSEIHRVDGGDRPGDSALADTLGEHLAPFRRQQLRIPQPADAVLRIQDHRPGHHRAKQRSAADFVHAGDPRRAQRPGSFFIAQRAAQLFQQAQLGRRWRQRPPRQSLSRRHHRSQQKGIRQSSSSRAGIRASGDSLPGVEKRIPFRSKLLRGVRLRAELGRACPGSRPT
jgi:hypothetical protein